MSGLPRAIYDGTASCATCVLWRPDDDVRRARYLRRADRYQTS